MTHCQWLSRISLQHVIQIKSFNSSCSNTVNYYESEASSIAFNPKWNDFNDKLNYILNLHFIAHAHLPINVWNFRNSNWIEGNVLYRGNW